MTAPQVLLSRIEAKTARLVIIGLGYVGLPVAARFAQVGFRVIGLEANLDKVNAVNAGQCPIEGEEPGLHELVAEVVAAGQLTATADYAVCSQADAIRSGPDRLGFLWAEAQDGT